MPFDDLTAEQQEFCRKYLGYSSSFLTPDKKKAKKQAELNSAFADFITMQDRVRSSLQSLAPDDTMGPAFLKRLEENYAGLTGPGKSKDKIAAARQGLLEIESDIQKHIRMEEANRAKITPEGQIRSLGNQARLEMLAASAKVDAATTLLVAEMTRLSAGSGVAIATPPEKVKSDKAFREASDHINGLCKPGIKVDVARKDIADTAKRYKDTAARLESEMLAALKDIPGLTRRVEAEKTADRLRGQLDDLEPVIEDLLRWGAPDAADLERRAAELRKAAVPTHADLMTTTQSGVAALVKAANDMRSLQIRTYEQASAALFRRMEALSRTVNDYNTDVKARRAAQLPQVDEASFLVTMSYDAYRAGKNPAALPAIEKMVEDAEKLVFDLKNSAVLNAEILAQIKDADAVIKKHEGSSAIRKEAWKGHREALAKFTEEWTGMRPASARAAGTDLILKVREEEKIEAGMKQWREAQLRRVDAARNELAKLEAEVKRIVEANGEKFGGYEGSLKADLDTCVEWITTKEAVSWQKPTETKIGQTQAKIMELLTNLAGRGVDPADPRKTGAELKLAAQKELIDDQDAAVKARSDAAIAKRDFLISAWDWLETAEMDADDSDRARQYKAEVKRIFDQTSGLIKNVEKDKQDVETGKRSLEVLKKQFSDLLARPPAINYAALGKMGDSWAAAVKNLDTNAKALVAAIRTENSDKDPAVMKANAAAADKLEAQLEIVVAGFDTPAFAQAAKVLGDRATPLTERKKAREVAQAAVRAMRAKLMNDPLMKACVANPFKVDAFGSAIYRTLNEIELETLRGI